MNIQEIATAVQYKLPIKIVILNNEYLGMVRQMQELFFRGRYSSTSMKVCPDFVRLAEAYGATGLRATQPHEVEEVLRKGLSTQGPVIIEFMVEPEENVFPMVPSGDSLKEMILT